MVTEPRAGARDAAIQVEFVIPSLPLRVLYQSPAKASFLILVFLHIPSAEALRYCQSCAARTKICALSHAWLVPDCYNLPANPHIETNFLGSE